MSKPLTQTTGRRKAAVARVRVRPGSGKVTINGKPIDQYFGTATQRNSAVEALRVTNTAEQYDVDATIIGGGVTGQSGAMRM
ncbi:MAG: 30S ribosomal protein S9, partial [Ilumatobacteraceae bacterium]